jgi:hypothetical protein
MMVYCMLLVPLFIGGAIVVYGLPSIERQLKEAEAD